MTMKHVLVSVIVLKHRFSLEGRIQSKLIKCAYKVRTLTRTSKDHNGQTISLTLDKGPRSRVQ